MGTRSLIVLEDGYNARGIYCVSDGYPKGVGLSLVIGYRKADMARQLVKVGAIDGIRFSIENAKLSHTHFDERKWPTIHKSLPIMVSAEPIDGKVNGYLKQQMLDLSAEYVYWGKVVLVDGEEIVSWSCTRWNGEQTDLYKLDRNDCTSRAYDVVQDVYGWKVVAYGHREEKDEIPCATEEQCRDYIMKTEFCPEREAA